jgi:hypothetical protein
MPNILTALIISGGFIFAPGFLAEVLVSERETKVAPLLFLLSSLPSLLHPLYFSPSPPPHPRRPANQGAQHARGDGS